MRAGGALAALVLLSLFAQDEAKVDKWVRDACGTNPLIRIQAARRVAGAGSKGLDAVLRFVESGGRSQLSTDLVHALGDFETPAARQLLRDLVTDRDFAWRPQALTALGRKPQADEAEIFQTRLGDRSWLMRSAALAGWSNLRGDEALPELQHALADEDVRVRVQAGSLLLASGKTLGLVALLEGLDAEDDFFGEDLGYLTRRQAFDALRAWASEDCGYLPQASHPGRSEGVARFRQRAQRVIPELPPRPAPPAAHAWRFGFEQRSCREGDLCARIDAEGRLWVGLFNPVEKPIEEAKRAAIVKAAGTAAARPLAGRIQCDYYRFTGLGEDGRGSVRCPPGKLPDALAELLELWRELAR